MSTPVLSAEYGASGHLAPTDFRDTARKPAAPNNTNGEWYGASVTLGICRQSKQVTIDIVATDFSADV
jgi:hypothetical protein